MKNSTQSNNSFSLSRREPKEYPVKSHEDMVCIDIALFLKEPNMKYILARRYQFGGVKEIQEAFSFVKDAIHRGVCRNPGGLFNSLLTRELKKKQNKKADDG